jgi:hypothetical protein
MVARNLLTGLMGGTNGEIQQTLLTPAFFKKTMLNMKASKSNEPQSRFHEQKRKSTTSLDEV